MKNLFFGIFDTKKDGIEFALIFCEENEKKGGNRMQFIDMHCDTLLECYLRNKPLRKNDLHIDLEKMQRTGGLLQFFAAYLISGKAAEEENITLSPYELFLEIEKLYRQQLAENRDILAPVESFADLARNQQAGKISSLLTIEDGVLLDGRPERLQILYEKGVRLMTLLWNYENCIGFPHSKDAAEHQRGLKEFGIEVVERMNDLGMIVDVSHLSEGGFYDVARYSKKPFVASHSCARALCDHSRNLTDEQLKCIAEAGGVVGVNFYAPFLRKDAEVSAIEDITAHIRHMIRVMGEECVAFGSDFDGIDCRLEMGDYEGFTRLIANLEREFSVETIEKLCFKNVIRVLKECI